MLSITQDRGSPWLGPGMVGHPEWCQGRWVTLNVARDGGAPWVLPGMVGHPECCQGWWVILSGARDGGSHWVVPGKVVHPEWYQGRWVTLNGTREGGSPWVVRGMVDIHGSILISPWVHTCEFARKQNWMEYCFFFPIPTNLIASVVAGQKNFSIIINHWSTCYFSTG